ncbi:Cell surface glycoprotein, partial [ANME-1 cluster archaeon GoMg1]|nr:Cell surface glycoprotein [ANME-1 cluster archaeon GoMg1]
MGLNESNKNSFSSSISVSYIDANYIAGGIGLLNESNKNSFSSVTISHINANYIVCGIGLVGSDNNEFQDCTISDLAAAVPVKSIGVGMIDSSDGNRILRTKICSGISSLIRFGVYVRNSFDNLLLESDISDCENGVLLNHSWGIKVTENEIKNNKQGVWLNQSDNNRIERNMIVNNTARPGVNLTSNSDSNEIHENCFYENEPQAMDNGSNNNWDGNYWSTPPGGSGDYTIPGDAESKDNEPLDECPLGEGPPPNITSFAPPSPVNDTVCTWRTFNVTVNQTVNVSWYLNGTAQVPKNVSVTEANFTFHAQYVGVHNVSAVAENADGTDMQTWAWNVTAAPAAAPNITSFAPPSPVNDTVCHWRTFNVTVNQTVNVSWYLNNSFLFKNASVMEANYTLHAQYVGENNVSAVARNANGTDMQTWIWNVTAAAPVLNCTCGDICVNTTGWWRASGGFNPSNTPIQDAIDNATAGDTICVKDGTYNENVDVDKRLTIKSENGSANCIVNALGSNDHVFEITADYVNISGFNVTGATGYDKAGIYLGSADHCNVSDNTASGNWAGIGLVASSNNTITSNTASANNKYGIGLLESDYNNITDNTASNNTVGIGLDHSNYNNISDNTASKNTAYGIGLEDSIYNTIMSNTVSVNADCGIALYSSEYNIITNNAASNNEYGIGLSNSRYNNISDNTATNNDCGIGLKEQSSYNNITSNTASANNEYGIGLSLSDYNNISDNTASANNEYGIGLSESDYNSLTSNTANSNGYLGILLHCSSNNNLTRNTANSMNIFHGIGLEFSSNNNLTRNTANSNNKDGIWLVYSSNNSLEGNTAKWNSDNGIELNHSSNNNLIYNNYFENTNNAKDNGNNEWNITKTAGTSIIGGPYLGGNYWSDYAGVDNDGDGLGNTLIPYNSSGNITTGGDWHPLTTVGYAPPNITSFAPPSPVNDTVCHWRRFNVTVNQTVNVSWYLNNSFLFKNESVREANYTLHAQYVGENNVSAVARNANGTDMQTWIWNVTAAAPVLNCTCGDICVNTTGWWRDGGVFNPSLEPIWAAVNSSAVGETICVKDGTYYETVDVTRSHLTIRSEHGPSVTTVSASLNPDEHVFDITDQTDVTLEGFEIRDAHGTSQDVAGIYMNNASECKISGNIVTDISATGWINDAYGIYLDSSSDNSFSSTDVSYINTDLTWGGMAYGIYIGYSNNNSFSTSTSVSYINSSIMEASGIILDCSHNNSFSTSTSVSYIYAFFGEASGITLWGSNNNSFSSSTNVFSITASATAYGIRLRDSNSNRFGSSTSISYLDATLEAFGILLEGSNNNRFSSSTSISYVNATTWDAFGIYIWDSSGNSFRSGSISDINAPDWWDFYSEEDAHGNSAEDITISSFPTTISFTYDKGIKLKSVETPPADPADKRNIGKYVNATDVTADSWLFLNVSYAEGDLGGVDENSLRLWKHNGTDWTEVPGTNGVNTAENYVYANITEFGSIFAPLGNVTGAKAPNITSFAPLSPVNDTVCTWRTFNVTVNQTVNVSWYLNGSHLFTNDSVTEANYTLHAEFVGDNNVSAVASNANGTDMQTWVWNVTAAPAPAPPNITSFAPPSPVNDTVCN